MATAGKHLSVSLRMIIGNSLLELTVLLIVAIDEKQVCLEGLLDIILDLVLLDSVR
jgi:hypothetical protein